MEKFNRQLWLPPPNPTPEELPPESPWSAESETAAFSAFTAQFEGLGK